MRLVLLPLIVAVTLASAKHVKLITAQCDGIELLGVFHKNEVLAKGLNRPYQLSYHKRKHEIFFSNNIGNDNEDKFEIKRLLQNGTDLTVEGIENGFATAIDEEKQVAYFGGNNGIYKMDLKDGNITKIVEVHNIWDMFFKKHLYFITYPHQKLYKYIKREAKKNKHHSKDKEEYEAVKEKMIHEDIYQFAIDGEGDIFITNETGLFMIKNGSEHRIHIQGEKVFRAVEINHKGQAYFCGKNGIHVVKKHENVLHEIASVKNIFGITFDTFGNIIYSNPHQIVKLLPSECKIIDNTVEYVPVQIPT